MRIEKVDNKQIEFPQLRGSIAGMKYPAMAEIKYDGELNYIIKSLDDIYTINKYGTIRRGFIALDKINTILISNNIKSVCMLTELHWNGGIQGALYDLLTHKKDDLVGLSVFDIIECDGTTYRNAELITRKELMHDIGISGWLAKCWVVNDSDEVSERFAEAIKMSYEGIVVKPLSSSYKNGPCCWVKMKYHDQNDYIISHIDQVKERIEVLVPAVSCSTDNIIVGVKACHRHKKYLKVGDQVTIEHQGVLASGSLRHPVLVPKKEWK